jgi:hypothetical protein
MTVKFASNELMPSPGGTVAAAVLVELEPPHAARMIAIPPANTNAVVDLSLRNCSALLKVVVVPLGNDEKGWPPVGNLLDTQDDSPLRWLPADIVGHGKGMRKREAALSNSL